MRQLPPFPSTADAEDFVRVDWNNRLRQQTMTPISESFLVKAGDPTTSDISVGQWAVYKNTVTGVIMMYVNDGGTIKRVAPPF